MSRLRRRGRRRSWATARGRLAGRGRPDPPAAVRRARGRRPARLPADERGDRVPDFSHAATGAGAWRSPTSRPGSWSSPGRGTTGRGSRPRSTTSRRCPPDARGLRGAVLLKAGRHEVAGPAPDRGRRASSSGARGTGRAGRSSSPRGPTAGPLIQVAGTGERADRRRAARTAIADDLRPDRLADRLRLDRRRTASGSATRSSSSIPARPPGSRRSGWTGSRPAMKGCWLKWLPGTLDVRFERVVTAIDGTAVTLDAPLTTSLDAALGGGTGPALLAGTGRIDRGRAWRTSAASRTSTAATRATRQHSWDAVAPRSGRGRLGPAGDRPPISPARRSGSGDESRAGHRRGLRVARAGLRGRRLPAAHVLHRRAS